MDIGYVAIAVIIVIVIILVIREGLRLREYEHRDDDWNKEFFGEDSE